ncbi:MAG: tetratricopeptide repeat protein [Ignavibacteriae bacterium]|nr:tetratricopeptide repeat protein [Ignavibacteriota bacterium]
MKKRSSLNTLKIDNFGYNVDGVYKADLGNYQEALNYFNKAIEIDPKNFISYFNRASIKMNLGDIEGAKMDFHKSENLASDKVNYNLV